MSYYLHSREGIRTELSQKAASRLDTLQGLLKDPPKKLSLRKDGFKLEEISPLGVIRYPGADPSIDVMVSALDKRKCCLGYKPGPHDHHSLKIPDNAIPRNRLSAEEPVWKSSLVHSQPFRSVHHILIHQGFIFIPLRVRGEDIRWLFVTVNS